MDPKRIIDAVECCHWCRQPSWMCRDASCDDTPTYLGVLRLGEWVETESEQPRSSLVGAR